MHVQHYLMSQQASSVSLPLTDVPPTESTKYPGVCPEEAVIEYYQSYSWLPFKGHCYMFVPDEIEWANAASSCVRHGEKTHSEKGHETPLNLVNTSVKLSVVFRWEGGTLASIEDPAEQEFITASVEIFKDSHNSFWIGLYKSHKGMMKR